MLDNASTDRTGQIAREIAASDDRIVVVRNEETVPVMRNHNLAVALTPPESHYMRILQGDDLLRPRCLELSVEVGEAHPEVGLIGSYLQWGDELTCNEFATGVSNFSGTEVARRSLLGEVYPFLTPSAILFRWDAARARDKFFDEQRLYGDVMACYELLREWDFGLVHEVLTDVGSSEASVTSTQYKPYNKLFASNLDLLARYGPDFLTDEAFELRMEERLALYYEFLAYTCFEGRPSDFWSFHRQALEDAGRPLSSGRLFKEVVERIGSNPRGCAWRLSRRWFGRG